MLCRPHNIALVDLEARAVVACLRLLQQAKEPECAHTRRPRHLHRPSDCYTKTTSASAASPGFLNSTPAELMQAKKQGVPTIELEVSSRAAAAAVLRRRRRHRHRRGCGGDDDIIITVVRWRLRHQHHQHGLVEAPMPTTYMRGIYCVCARAHVRVCGCACVNYLHQICMIDD
ncbi:uncharacterized protein LOC119268281 [Triticum dicoccoides]|uniref:uncharacterized protein LOC119268281 n=1 Tax=Triticum dicoccoides TaxID=85692 RepID=UPI00188E6CDC|nr:uncharacterized protein LOC119268281 [Triticum dicoccoides]